MTSLSMQIVHYNNNSIICDYKGGGGGGDGGEQSHVEPSIWSESPKD